MKTTESNIPFSYKTIKITQSRIDKGLLAIPVSLIDYFSILWRKSSKHYIITNEDSPAHPNGRAFFYPEKYKSYTIETHYARERGLKVLVDLCNKLGIDFETIEV